VDNGNLKDKDMQHIGCQESEIDDTGFCKISSENNAKLL